MKPGISAALALSVLLIGGASWYRFSQPASYDGLVAIEKEAMTDKQYKDMLATFLSTSSSTTEAENLTGTDLIGRQLILDYVGLARNGQASPENLSLLAENYVDSLPTLISAQKIYYTDIQVVANNSSNFQKYSTDMEAIYQNYGSAFFNSYSERDYLSETDGGASMYLKMAEVYQQTSDKMKSLSVPEEISQNHLALINLYLENAAAMSSVSKSQTDTASSFAGIVTISSNLEKEQSLLDEIEEVVNDNV